MTGVSLASNEYGTGPEFQLSLCGAGLTALSGTPVAAGAFVCERKHQVRRKDYLGRGVFVPQSPSWLDLAAGAELQQANIWAEPLAVFSIFRLLLWVRGLGPLPTNRGMQRKLFSRIVWNGTIGMISPLRHTWWFYSTANLLLIPHLTGLYSCKSVV